MSAEDALQEKPTRSARSWVPRRDAHPTPHEETMANGCDECETKPVELPRPLEKIERMLGASE